MRNIQKVLLHLKSGKKFLVKDLDDDYITPFGKIAAKDLNKEQAVSDKKEKFAVFNPNFVDLWESMNRGPQIMVQKDIGLVIAKTGINKDSRIVDAGGGSGALCLSLANLCKEVVSYEINPEHFSILQKNKEMFGMKNLVLKQENISDDITEKELDLITLDLPEPWKVVEHAEKALKIGGFVVVYLPNLTQVQKFVESTLRSRINIIETVELLERKWKVEEQILRPEFQMLGHTGFTLICRKL